MKENEKLQKEVLGKPYLLYSTLEHNQKKRIYGTQDRVLKDSQRRVNDMNKQLKDKDRQIKELIEKNSKVILC